MAIANANVNIFDFGYYHALSDAAKTVTGISRATFTADRYSVHQQVVLLYIEWLRKYRLLLIRREDVQRDSILMSLIRANVNSGLRPGADSSTALAAFSGARIAYLRAMNDFDLLKDQLQGITGALPSGTNPDTMMVGRTALRNFSVLASTDSVVNNHPLLDVYSQKYTAQLALNRADEKQFLPKLQLNAAYWVRNTGVAASGQFSDGFGMPYSAYNYLFGLTATVNLTDLKLRHDHIRENEYRAQSGMYELRNEQLELATQYAQARTSYASTMAQLEELPILENAANMSFQQQLALYRAGLNTLTDVTNAEYTLLQAETNLVVTQTDLVKLEYLLAALGGKQDLFIEQFKH